MAVQDVIVAKQYCLDHGISITGPCGAFNITGRVAYNLKAEGWGLVHKESSQNGCSINDERYGVDVVMLKNGTTIDMLINSETENIPAWNVTGSAPLASWREPFNMDSDVPPNPNPIPVPSECAKAARLEDLIASINTQYTILNGKLDKILAKP